MTPTSMLALPLLLHAWTPIAIPRKSAATITELKPQGFLAKTESSASGLAMMLPKPISFAPHSPTQALLKFRYRIEAFPNVTGSQKNPLQQMNPKQDDFALRVGLLIDDGSTRFTRAEKLGLTKERISRVLFLAPSPASFIESPEPNCVQNPYFQEVSNCAYRAALDREELKTIDLRKLILGEMAQETTLKGIFLFFDSDDTKSRSIVKIYDIYVDMMD